MPCALPIRSEEHTSELQSHDNLVCRLLLEKKKTEEFAVFSQIYYEKGWNAYIDVHFKPHAIVFFFFFNDTAPTEIYTLPYTTLFQSRDAGDLLAVCPRRARQQRRPAACAHRRRSEEHTSELQSHDNLVWRLLLEKKRFGNFTGARGRPQGADGHGALARHRE